MQQDESNSTTPTKKRKAPRRIVIATVVLATLAAAIYFVGPPILSSNLFRDRILRAAIDNDSLRIESQSASFGWFTPVVVRGLRIDSPEDRLKIEVAEIRSDRTWLQLWRSRADLGHVDVESPVVNCQLQWESFEGYSAGKVPQFSATVQNGSLTVDLEQFEEHAIDVANLNIDFRVAGEGKQQALVIDSTTLIDNRPLTPDMCRELLQLVDPMLGDVVAVEGAASIEIDHLRVPLNVSTQQQQQQLELNGRLLLSGVTTSAKTPLIKGIVRVAADMYGQQATEEVRMVNHAAVEFEVRNGRLYHSGLEFGLPDIAPELIVTSQGSVGLDESLDLHVSIPKLFLMEESTAEAEAAEAVHLHITGSIQKPSVARLDYIEDNATHELSTHIHPPIAVSATPASHAQATPANEPAAD